MDGGAWWAPVHGVAKSWAQLSAFTFTFRTKSQFFSSLSPLSTLPVVLKFESV